MRPQVQILLAPHHHETPWPVWPGGLLRPSCGVPGLGPPTLISSHQVCSVPLRGVGVLCAGRGGAPLPPDRSPAGRGGAGLWCGGGRALTRSTGVGRGKARLLVAEQPGLSRAVGAVREFAGTSGEPETARVGCGEAGGPPRAQRLSGLKRAQRLSAGAGGGRCGALRGTSCRRSRGQEPGQGPGSRAGGDGTWGILRGPPRGCAVSSWGAGHS